MIFMAGVFFASVVTKYNSLMEDIISAKKEIGWKVWVDEAENKLHVHGELRVEDKSLFYQLGKFEQGYLKDELILELTPKPAPGNELVAVKYHEEVNNSNQYKKVVIMSGAEEIASLDVTVK